ncbi:MAG: SIS domain-containing protein [Syntrophaceae bacterium]|nr:SIS domain-containing protein [Syntrophaceae bacterium]
MMRFIRHIGRFGAGVVRALAAWDVFVGKRPEDVRGPAVILFPLQLGLLACGLAGIVTIRRAGSPGETAGVERLRLVLGRVREKGMKALRMGALQPPDYLEPETLRELDAGASRLKEDGPYQDLFFRDGQVADLRLLCAELEGFVGQEEKELEEAATSFSTADLEILGSRQILLKDILWTLEKDVLANVDRIAALAGASSPQDVDPAAFGKYRRMNFLLNCVDRLEVRGRDSAGLELAVTFPDAERFRRLEDVLREEGLYEDYSRRSCGGDLLNGSIRISERAAAGDPGRRDVTATFVYKTSSIIGELGRNVRELREAVSRDAVLRLFARQEALLETSMTHTRWASVGSITEENCHPVNSFTLADRKGRKAYPRYGEGNWTIHVVLNGDIDNYPALRKNLEVEGELIVPELTTDTKIIPLQIERYLLEGHDLTESFRLAVSDFEGSHAIAMTSDLEPGKAFLALKGSGQTIYVGLAPDQYIFSSELYGLVEGTPRFVKMDGETPSHPDMPESTGQIFVLHQESEGGLAGIRAFAYDGSPITLGDASIKRAEMTTRDIDRGTHAHFFLKEINESALSIRKTLRGKYRILRKAGEDPQVAFNIGEDIVPLSVRSDLREGTIRRIMVIGHGTAAVAGSAVADAMERHLRGTRIRVEGKVASELSGFSLEDDLKDMLVVPITQSGTTTDTNRAVAMAHERGARVVAIVNRRQSDITSKSDGVFYTSDGRDIEMSVASTKAFYSQIVAGHILALFIAQLMGSLSDEDIAEELSSLEQAPEMMKRVLARKDLVRYSAELLAKRKRYWAIVGSGPNKAAADEIRIKLSELCYRTISSDVTENKKHIDLSAEPLIIVCAAGNPETVVGDLVKDVAIFKAHKAAVVVFADEGEERFDALADSVIPIPPARMPLPVILNTLAGHLWGYYAACSIHQDSLFLRDFRNRIQQSMVDPTGRAVTFYERMADRTFRRMIRDFSNTFHKLRDEGAFSATSVKAVSDIMLLLKYAMGKLPLEDFWYDFRGDNGPVTPLDLLDITLAQAAEDLSRPVDAIRHQAKTVTVGTSRKVVPLRGIFFDLFRDLGFTVKDLSSRDIIVLRRIQPAVAAINGYTLYAIDRLDDDGRPVDQTTIAIRQRGGVSLEMASRTEGTKTLMGTKRTIVRTGRVYVGRGKSDGASIVIVPLLKGGMVRHLLLIHVRYNEALTLREKVEVIGYAYNEIRNLVNEYNLAWKDQYLESFTLEVLLSEPPEVIAGKIKQMLEQA